MKSYVFWVTLSFYILLLIFNPSNYIIAFSFAILFLAYYLKIKKFELSLFLTYASSLIVQTGKTYPIQLISAGVFPIEIFPRGYFVNIVITATLFIGFVMLLYIIRQLILKPHIFKLNLVDYLLIVFFILKILSSVLGSKQPQLSLPFEILSLSSLVAYFYARIFLKLGPFLWRNLAYLLSALVIFESLLGFSELAVKSPLGKNLENQLEIEYFGHAVDETLFTFRPAGTFNHANAVGVWVASVCVFLFITCLKNKSNIFWLSFFSGCTLMIITLSRSAWLGFAAGFVFMITYIVRRNKNAFKPLISLILKWRFLIFSVLLLLVLFFVIPRAQSSLYSFRPDAGAVFFRRTQILDAIEIIKLHPIFGIGAAMGIYEGISLNLYTMAASIPLQVDDWYVNIALVNGLPALFIFICFLTLSVKSLFVLYKNTIIPISIVGSIICLLVAGIFQPDINFVFILLLLSLANGDNIKPIKYEKDFEISKKQD